jgi:hypothetical protein
MPKEVMSLSEVISNSFKEFGENWKTFLGILVLLSFIPAALFLILELFWMKQADYFNVVASSNFSGLISQLFSPLGALLIVGFVVLVLFGIWLQSSFIYKILSKNKSAGVFESLRGGRKYFWKFLGLAIIFILVFAIPLLVIIGIIALVVLLGTANLILSAILVVIIIVAIIAYFIFVTYLWIKWIFSFYILIAENKRVISSLKSSKELVSGRWWRTFGSVLLFLLIIWGISILFYIPAAIINMALSFGALGSSAISSSGSLASFTPALSNMMMVSTVVSFIFNILSQIIVFPLIILFVKNLYFSRKNSKK